VALNLEAVAFRVGGGGARKSVIEPGTGGGLRTFTTVAGGCMAGAGPLCDWVRSAMSWPGGGGERIERRTVARIRGEGGGSGGGFASSDCHMSSADPPFGEGDGGSDTAGAGDAVADTDDASSNDVDIGEVEGYGEKDGDIAGEGEGEGEPAQTLHSEHAQEGEARWQRLVDWCGDLHQISQDGLPHVVASGRTRGFLRGCAGGLGGRDGAGEGGWAGGSGGEASSSCSESGLSAGGDWDGNESMSSNAKEGGGGGGSSCHSEAGEGACLLIKSGGGGGDGIGHHGGGGGCGLIFLWTCR